MSSPMEISVLNKCDDCGKDKNGYTDIVCSNCYKKRERWKELTGISRQSLIDIILKLEFKE